MQPDHYIIQGGNQGSDRLKILAEATWPTSKTFLENAGIKPHMHCLDLGCGNGEITRKLSDLLDSSGKITGIDADPVSIHIAKSEVLNANPSNQPSNRPTINWKISDLEKASELEPCDFIYARFLLSHLRDPETLLRTLHATLKPGGIIAIEDVDFNGHFSYPILPEFDRYVELYTLAGKSKGADPLIGPKLPALLSNAGFSNIKMNVILPTFMSGEGKLMALLTLKSIQKAVVESKLSTDTEIEELTMKLEAFTRDPSTMMSLPGIFQVWATK
jgi:ubiquinone/menaquinone biosynthesis C-methylase UbiE